LLSASVLKDNAIIFYINIAVSLSWTLTKSPSKVHVANIRPVSKDFKFLLFDYYKDNMFAIRVIKLNF